MRQFADRIDDSLGDVIALALEIAVSARASERVPGVLRQMADAAADEVKARRQIEVDRAAPRNEARVLVLFNIAVIAVVVVFTDYTAPYADPLGQVWLAILMVALAASMWLIRKYSLGENTPRILTSGSAPGERAGGCLAGFAGGGAVMSSLWLTALLAGAALGVGVGVLLYVTAAPARPALAPLMKRAGSRPAPVITVTAPAPVPRNGWSRLAAARLSRWVDVEWLNSPDADLAVIEKSRQQFLLERVGLATVGLLVVPIWGVMLWALGIELPVVIPALGSVALAVLFWLVPANRVTVAAAERRREMRYALVSYLTLVALHRAAGEGAAASLELAAVASDSWAFRRIDRQVSAALRAQRTEWQALQDLAHELQIDELADLSSIAETAGVMGAHIGPTLLARAASLRHELMAKEQSAAAESTNRMVFPKMMLAFVVVGFLLFPPFMTLVFT